MFAFFYYIHIQDFYVHNYVTGMAAAYLLSQGILKGEKGAVDRYMSFLKAGSSDNPVEILKRAGVGMNSTKPVDDLLKLFGDLVDQMERLLREEGKIKQRNRKGRMTVICPLFLYSVPQAPIYAPHCRIFSLLRRGCTSSRQSIRASALPLLS